MADFEYVTHTAATPPAEGKKAPLDLSHHYSRVTKKRVESSIKKFYQFFSIPGIGNLSGGLPNASYFPYDTLEAQIAQPERFQPTPNGPSLVGNAQKARSPTSSSKPSTDAPLHLVVPHASGTANPIQKIDLTTALQYGQAQGYPPLYSFLRQFTRENLHPNVPYLNGPDIILTCGSTDGFSKTLEALSNIWSEERDWIREREGLLCEEFAYMNAIQTARPRGLQIVPVKVDSEGMVAAGKGGLADVLENWDEAKGKRPHLMYTVTIGQNPTSGTLSVQRRKELYALCSKYDIIIIEDDPYWYLQFPSAANLESQARGTRLPASQPVHTFEKSSGYAYLDSLVPSYLSVDTDGRVVRLDTFSKTVAPGCRLGWITAQPAIVERILRITESSTQQPSGFVQSMIAELLMGPQPDVQYAPKSKSEALAFTGWQTGGWVRWLEGLRGSYERRMNRMCSILEDGRFQVKQGTPLKASEQDWAVISKTELYSFNWPSGGMFVWIRINFPAHPLFGQVEGPKLADALWLFLANKPYLALVSPGKLFGPTPEIQEEKGWQYFRLCFAAVSEEEIETTSKRFADGCAAFWKIKTKKELDDIDNPTQLETIQEGITDLGLNWVC